LAESALQGAVAVIIRVDRPKQAVRQSLVVQFKEDLFAFDRGAIVVKK